MDKATDKGSLFRVVLVLGIVGLVGDIASFFFQVPQGGMNILLVILFPLLWILWFAYAIGTSRTKSSQTLLWLLIDVGILLLMTAAWHSNRNLARSPGTDLVVYMLYFPVITPLGLILYWIDDLTSALISLLKVGDVDFGAGPGKAFSIWVSFSLIAAIQSFLVVSICKRLRLAWQKRSPRTSSIK